MKLTIVFFLLTFYAANLSAQTRNDEFRSIWVVTWEYISASSSPDQNKARIRTILDSLKAANMTSVIWQVRQSGTAYYNSSWEPYGSYAGNQYPGFDPLAYAIEEAHKRGLELHAWFNVFASGSTAPGTPAQEHPEWICRDRDNIPMNQNICLSPGLPEVRSYLNSVAMEVVRNYDIDGFHLDYIRWNEYTNGDPEPKTGDEQMPDGYISNEQLNNLTENSAGRYLYDVQHPYSGGIPSGYPSWEDFWRSTVTDFVRILQDSIKSVKPYVKLSCAALGNYNWGGWNGYYTVFQDAALWFNMGYVDQIAGMHYHWTTGSGFVGMLNGQCPSCWSDFIQPGIAAGRLFTVGPPSYILHETNQWNNHQDIINSIRTVPWVDGFQFFSYASWRDRHYFSDAASLFIKNKKKVRNALSSSETVPVPQVQITKIDSFHYRLNVAPPALSQPYWFAVYRSETTSFSKDTTSIVDVRFTDSAFTVEQNFDGLQDFNGRYRYSVTMLNRYWKESEFSNIVETDPVTSKAPTVVSTIPAEGDTVAINSTVRINFSKTINRSNLLNYFSFDPPVEIASISSEPKKVVITTTGFQFNTSYTLRIDSLLTDINGRMLDGNNDGIEGDPFYLHFVSVDVDTVGPNIMVSYPVHNDSTDIDDVISFVFNETLTLSSVTGNVILYKNGAAVLSEIGALNTASGAVISIKPKLPFERYASYRCVVSKEIKDAYQNKMQADYILDFTAKGEGYTAVTMIDDFSNQIGWQSPGYSGSTVGILIPPSSFGYTSSVYIPATLPRMSGALTYKWDPNASTHFIREYLAEGPARDVTFDTSYILQLYIFGDGSGSLFRFALDESVGGSWPNHEVGLYRNINWWGWRIVEWDLSDPNSVGTWIGNGVLDGTSYRIDSFQLTDSAGSASEGKIYFDNLRLVKKSYDISSADNISELPSQFRLYQNYPNPFNPSTIISFDIDKPGLVNLDIYDVLGRKVKSLVAEELKAGAYKINFDASELASGQYIYRLISGSNQISKMMLLLK